MSAATGQRPGRGSFALLETVQQSDAIDLPACCGWSATQPRFDEIRRSRNTLQLYSRRRYSITL